MEKDFDTWNHKKKQVHRTDTSDVFFYEREVWWVHLGLNVGFEQDGTGEGFDRPVVVLKKFNPDVFLAVPLSTTDKTGKYYFHVGKVEEREATAILSQIRLLDARRLINRAGTIQADIFSELVEKLVSANFPKADKNSPPPFGRG